jgi:hypothetical protein
LAPAEQLLQSAPEQPALGLAPPEQELDQKSEHCLGNLLAEEQAGKPSRRNSNSEWVLLVAANSCTHLETGLLKELTLLQKTKTLSS